MRPNRPTVLFLTGVRQAVAQWGRPFAPSKSTITLSGDIAHTSIRVLRETQRVWSEDPSSSSRVSRAFSVDCAGVMGAVTTEMVSSPPSSISQPAAVAPDHRFHRWLRPGPPSSPRRPSEPWLDQRQLPNQSWRAS